MNKKLNIIKRDGSIVEFNKEKIENAILSFNPLSSPLSKLTSEKLKSASITPDTV